MNEGGELVPRSADVTLQDRQERLSQIVSTRAMQGFSVVDRNDRNATAVLMRPAKPVNHVLHAILTLFSCGLWVIVWIILAATQKREQRVRVTIDGQGNLVEETMTA